MEQVILTVVIFGLGFAGMAVGVIVAGRGKELKGSCGGVGSNPDCCMTCPDKPKCDDASALSEELAHVAGQRTEDHPALGQHP